MTDDVPNVNGWFPTFLLTFFGISFWYFFGLPRDLLISLTISISISDFFRSVEDSFCDGYFFSFVSIFIFFFNSEEAALCVFRLLEFTDVETTWGREHKNIQVETDIRIFAKNWIRSFIQTAFLIVLKST